MSLISLTYFLNYFYGKIKLLNMIFLYIEFIMNKQKLSNIFFNSKVYY